MDYFQVGDAAQIVHEASGELNGMYCEILEVEPEIGVRLIPSGRSGRIDAKHLKRVGGPDIVRSIMLQRTGRSHWPERMINDGRVEDSDLIAPIVISEGEERQYTGVEGDPLFHGDGGEAGGAGASGNWDEQKETESQSPSEAEQSSPSESDSPASSDSSNDSSSNDSSSSE